MYNELNIQPDEILLYSRKSRSDDPLLSVEEVLAKHETILNNWCENNLDGVIPEKNRLREVVSGETIDDRPYMLELLKRIESPKIKAVLVVEVQRLSRGDLEDAGRLIKLLRYTNTLVITPPKTYNLNDEYDRDAFERELKRGNEFLEYQKKIMNRGRLLSVQQGNYIGSKPPYGYERVVVMDGKRKCHTLKIKEDEAEVVKMAYDMYINQDVGGTIIANKLNSLGIKPPKGEYWTYNTIKGILGNIHYIGKVKWNWRKTVVVVEEGEVIKTRPKSKIDEYLVFDGKHEAIISEELFLAAQEKQGKNHRAKPTTKVRNPLAGLVYCKCGRAMSLRIYKKDGVERSAARLICDNQTYCKTTSCRYDEMLGLVHDILENCIADFEIRIAEDNTDTRKMHNNLVRQLEKKLDELNRKEISQWEKYSEEGMPKQIFENLNAKVLKEKEEVTQALSNAKEAMPDPVDYKEKLYRFKDALNALDNQEISAEKKNRLLKTCIERIDYNREKAHRLKREPNEKKGERFKKSGSYWSTSPIELKVKLYSKPDLKA